MKLEKESNILLEEGSINKLIEEVYQKYGYDFSDYSRSSLRRRISRIMAKDSLLSFAELYYKLLEDEYYFNHFLKEVTVNVTEMFRDPIFYKELRNKVIPQLKTYPLIRVWHAGCSTGEEVFSMAILLKEEGLLDRSILYATDINQGVLETAKTGQYSIDDMKMYSKNYILSGGKGEFSKYYTAKYGKAIFRDDLRQKMVFSTHNLVSDQSFNEFNIILCRNVLIYFNRDLQNRVNNLFYNSLPNLGFLALGTKESINFTDRYQDFGVISSKQKIWRKTN